MVLTAEFIEVIHFTINGFKLLEDGNVMQNMLVWSDSNALYIVSAFSWYIEQK